MIVVDTNVMVQFVAADDEYVAAAELYRRDSAWSAPPILMSELRNVLVGLVRRGDITEEQATAMTDDASAILGDRVAVSGRQTMATALECGLTAYDAEFVVLARRLHVPLATLDQAILNSLWQNPRGPVAVQMQSRQSVSERQPPAGGQLP